MGTYLCAAEKEFAKSGSIWLSEVQWEDKLSTDIDWISVGGAALGQ